MSLGFVQFLEQHNPLAFRKFKVKSQQVQMCLAERIKLVRVAILADCSARTVSNSEFTMTHESARTVHSI